MDDNPKKEDSKEAFLNSLSTEIEQIREDMKLPGWSRWAIVGSLAPIFWLLVLEIEKQVFNLHQTFLLFVIISSVVALGRIFYEWAKPKLTEDRVRFKAAGEIITDNVLSITYGFLSSLFTIFLVINFFSNVSKSVYYSIIGCNLMYLLMPLTLGFARMISKRYTKEDYYVPDAETSSPNYNFSIAYKLLGNRDRLRSIESIGKSSPKNEFQNMVVAIVSFSTSIG